MDFLKRFFGTLIGPHAKHMPAKGSEWHPTRISKLDHALTGPARSKLLLPEGHGIGGGISRLEPVPQIKPPSRVVRPHLERHREASLGFGQAIDCLQQGLAHSQSAMRRRDRQIVDIQSRPRLERGKPHKADGYSHPFPVALRQQPSKGWNPSQPRNQILADIRGQGSAVSHGILRVLIQQVQQGAGMLWVVQIDLNDGAGEAWGHGGLTDEERPLIGRA